MVDGEMAGMARRTALWEQRWLLILWAEATCREGRGGSTEEEACLVLGFQPTVSKQSAHLHWNQTKKSIEARRIFATKFTDSRRAVSCHRVTRAPRQQELSP